MVNNLGKSLVLFQVALSTILVTWATAIFLSPIDWGKREASKAWHDPAEGKQTPVNERVAAEIDKHMVAHRNAINAKRAAKARYEQAEKRFAGFEGKFATNHLEYVQILDRLDGVRMDGLGKAAPVKPADFNDVKNAADGSVALVGGMPWGLPVRDTAVPGTKSYTEYLADLAAKMNEITGVLEKIDKLVKQKETITIRLNGLKDDKGKQLKPGLYQLIEGESLAQRKLIDELSYFEPLWVARATMNCG